MFSCKKEDKTSPSIQLTGKDTIYLNLHDTWIEPGFVATDNNDGNITGNVSVSGSVNTDIVNVYSLEYSVSDDAGNNASVKRLVYIKADSLQGDYTIDAVVTGTNAGNYTYAVLVIPGSEYNILQFQNFCDLGNAVKIEVLVNGSAVIIPNQTLTGVNPGYEGSITGQGSYNGADKKLLLLQYTLNYFNGGMDNGTASFTRN
ncbi:MAG: DUF5011 domain-containing protein [Bacteroidales bacterium]